MSEYYDRSGRNMGANRDQVQDIVYGPSPYRPSQPNWDFEPEYPSMRVRVPLLDDYREPGRPQALNPASIRFTPEERLEIGRRASAVGMTPADFLQRSLRSIYGPMAPTIAGNTFKRGLLEPKAKQGAPPSNSADGYKRSVDTDASLTSANLQGREEALRRYLEKRRQALAEKAPQRQRMGFRTQDLLLGALPALFMGKQGGEYLANYVQGKMAGDQQKYGDQVEAWQNRQRQLLGEADVYQDAANLYDRRYREEPPPQPKSNGPTGSGKSLGDLVDAHLKGGDLAGAFALAPKVMSLHRNDVRGIMPEDDFKAMNERQAKVIRGWQFLQGASKAYQRNDAPEFQKNAEHLSGVIRQLEEYIDGLETERSWLEGLHFRATDYDGNNLPGSDPEAWSQRVRALNTIATQMRLGTRMLNEAIQYRQVAGRIGQR